MLTRRSFIPAIAAPLATPAIAWLPASRPRWYSKTFYNPPTPEPKVGDKLPVLVRCIENGKIRSQDILLGTIAAIGSYEWLVQIGCRNLNFGADVYNTFVSFQVPKTTAPLRWDIGPDSPMCAATFKLWQGARKHSELTEEKLNSHVGSFMEKYPNAEG